MKYNSLFLFLSCSFVTMIGCTTQTSSYEMGPSLTDEDLANITPDTTKDQVIEQYGEPSFRCFNPGNHSICYFHQAKKDDVIVEQREVEIEFDENGKVIRIRIYTPLSQAYPEKKVVEKNKDS